MSDSVAIRDDCYYDEDGNAVFRAQDVLFRVHRSRLARSSVVFKSLFDLPLEDPGQLEGITDDRPIVLSDDAEDVRALLWALHMLPYQVMALFQEPANEATCLKLLRVCQVAHKYEFEHLDRWALDTVFAFLHNIPFDLDHGFISRLFEVTRLCAPDELSVAEEIIRAALEAKRADLSVVLSTADEHGLKALAGHAYHRILLKGNWVNDASLSLTLRTNLLHGYHAFTELWLEIRRSQPAIVRHSCPHLGPCLWMWAEIWREAIHSPELLAVPPADVLGKLQKIKTSAAFTRERSGTWPEKGGTLTFMCRAGATAAIDERAAEIESKLIDFFRMPILDTQRH